MARIHWRLFVAFLSIVITAAASPAQTPAAPSTAYRNRLLGVFNAQTGDPIEGAEVTDVLQHVSALTTKTGTITLAFLPDGGSLVKVQKIGFEPMSLVVAISPADTVPVTIALAPLAQQLPTMVTKDSAPHYVSSALRDFEERRKSGFGYFISSDELRKNESTTMTNMIRRIPGINIVCARRGGACTATSMRHTSINASCPVAVFIDGIPSTDRDLQKILIIEYAGVEYYGGAGAIPAQFNATGSACGVLLFWSRER